MRNNVIIKTFVICGLKNNQAISLSMSNATIVGNHEKQGNGF